MESIVIDIETTPNATGAALAEAQADAAKRKAEVKAPSNYKDPEKIAAYIAEKHAEIDAEVHDKVLKTSFDGALGHIAVIGLAIDDEDPIAFFEDSTEPHKHEAQVLKGFYEFIRSQFDSTRDRRPIWVGHHLTEFDLRFIFQRSVVLGIKPPPFIPFAAKPWDDVVYDTMTRWAGVKGSIKLDKLARCLGFEGKGDIDGSMVWPMVAEGRIKEVAEYCKNDVAQTRKVFKRLTFQA